VTLRVLAVWVCLMAGAAAAAAQDQPPEGIEPDRPDVTNGTHIVDIGLLQIELGGLYARANPSVQSFGTPVTARVGLTAWFEARIGTDGLVALEKSGGTTTGVGNLQIGGKLRLWSDPGGVPVLSILPQVNISTASAEKGLGSGAADYTVAVLTGTDIGRHAHVDINYGIGAIGAPDGAPHFIQHLASVSASMAASDNWNPYVESFWLSRDDPDGAAVVGIDAGAIYELGARYALDGGVQFGVTSSAPAFAAFGGISIIVGDILGAHGVHARQRQRQRRAAAPRR
jgi:outer membrane putative beta-barrel porin/alpha-amylase